MNENSRNVVGVDIGTSKVRVIIANFDKEGMPNVIGVGSAENNGMKKGVITNAQSVYQALDKALLQAERMAGYESSSAIFSVNGAHILSTNTDGMIAINSPDGIVDEEDLQRVEEVATIGKIPANHRVLEFIPYYYNLDNQEGLVDPYGMEGVRLEVHGSAISALDSNIDNLRNTAARLDLDPELYVPSVLASSRALLTDNQKENGVAVVDLGASTPGVAVYEDGALRLIEVIPLGGINITNDLAICLKVSPEVAEEIKIKHGFAFEREESGDIVVKHGREHYSFNTREIEEVIEARLEEIFEEVKKVLKKSGFENQLPNGIVLAGAGSNLKGIDEYARKQLQLATRIGKNGVERTVSQEVNKPEFSAAVGLIIEARNVVLRREEYRDSFEPKSFGFFARFFKKKR